MSKDKQAPFFGLSRKYRRRSAADFLDMDYVGLLSESEKRFLDIFCRNHYRADFTGATNVIADDKRKACYGENNARNRDGWNQWARQMGDGVDYLNELEAEDDE